MVSVKVDEEKCIGCGGCEATCPKTFEMKDGANGMKAVVKAQPQEITCEKEAVDICPVDAISVS